MSKLTPFFGIRFLMERRSPTRRETTSLFQRAGSETGAPHPRSHREITCGYRHIWRTIPASLAFLLAGFALSAAELKLKVVDQDPPKALDAAISATLQKKAIQLLDGDKPVYEFWFVSELPLTSKPASPAKALDSAKQATLLGAVSVPKAMKDYRDDELAAGVYTMRFALQPQDGNHLGSAEFTYFAVLVPAKLDTKPGGISDYKPLVKASSKETATDHPVILSLRPASSTDGDLPKLNEPAPEHKSVRVRVPAKAGEEKTSVVFEVVYEGKGHK
jgi:hypothetical protein